jgi:endonuclease/exonuclease/phosphatase (EEP) superfamily protein YafD
LRALVFDHYWWLALLNTLALYLFLPLPLLLSASIWRRRWTLALGLALPTAAFAALYGTLLLPRQSPAEARGPAVITAMSFNVLTSNKDTKALERAIRAAPPDILGMQELTGAKRAALRAAFSQDLPYHTFDQPEAFGNIGLMSRYPIETVTQVALPTSQPALHAIVRVGSLQLHVFVAHVSPNHLFKNPSVGLATAASSAYARRAAEVARLREEIDNLDAPVLVLCDCNLTDISQAYAELGAVLADSFREAGWGLRNTNGGSLFGTFVPLQRIDYIWHSAGVVPLDAAVGQQGGSDHLPVVARLRLGQ